jgi:anti-sigma B factor antagonist
MQPEVRDRGDVSIIDLPGRITHSSGDFEMRQTIQSLLDQGKRKLLVNLEKCTFMDSAGIGELVACHKRAVEKGGVIKIMGANEKMLDLLTITKLITVFDVYKTETEALHSF